MALINKDGDPAQAEAWRQRYYDSLDALEKQEQEWRQIEALLRQTLLRLISYTDLAEPGLATRLDELRGELRRGTDTRELAPLLEDLGCGLAQQESAAGLPGPGLAFAREILTTLTDRLLTDAPADATRFIRAAVTGSESDMRRAVGHLVDLVQERVDGGGSINQALLRLLEYIAVPRELTERAEALRGLLQEPLTPVAVEGVLRSLAELIADMRVGALREKRALEDFLSQLTDGLQTLDQNLHATVKAQIDSFQEGRRLGSAIDVHMDGIDAAVQSAQGLDQLKSLLDSRVHAIRDDMAAFHRLEEQRAAELERDMSSLTERLAALESEAEGLRERVRVERCQALLDPLTGLPNRLAYDERVVQEYQRWRRYGSPLVLSIWDVDHFKRVNDSYGHQAGDKVLRVIATLLKSQTRVTDFICRYGGEEFIMLLPETELASALSCVEKVRATVENAEFHHRGARVKVTVSCGVAQFRGEDIVEDVFNRADQALYAAKRAGRNCCRTDLGVN